ncbi:MAG: asparagine synthase (glutamine-hydrolyzing) [Candidatus Eisenbacteria bacterium]
MCGFAGIYNFDRDDPVPRDVLAAMGEILRHRGPDAGDIWTQGQVGFAHRRLSVIDIAGGAQPMRRDNPGRVIAYNGEMYNFLELKRDLQAAGATFRTRSDTEVVLAMADPRNLAWLDALTGMFAFAVWDEASRTLLLARDRVGIKPLYYHVSTRALVFGSEIKALLQHPAVDARVNAAAIPEYLAFRNVAGPETLFEGILELPPGACAVVRPGARAPEIIQYWRDGNAFEQELPPGARGAAGLEEVLRDSVSRHMVADVPVGTYNSGGVDSSVVSHIVRGVTTGELHTFSVGFAEATHDESRHAELVARAIGSTHHSIVIGAAEYAADFPRTIWHVDEPLHHAHTVQLLGLSELAKRHVTVVLTGEGADELFAGYPRYQIPLLARRLKWLPRVLLGGGRALAAATGRRRLEKLLAVAHDPRLALIENSRFATRAQLAAVAAGARGDGARMAGPQAYGARATIADEVAGLTLNELERVLAYDRRTYLPSLLQRLDRTTMAHGLEGRVPFLDHHVLAWSKTVPMGAKLTIGRQNKVLLKRHAAALFPGASMYRRKMGFDVPVGRWLRDDRALGRYAGLLTERTFAERGLVDARAVARMVDDHRTGRADHAEILWPLVNLEVWLRIFVDRTLDARGGAQP